MTIKVKSFVRNGHLVQSYSRKGDKKQESKRSHLLRNSLIGVAALPAAAVLGYKGGKLHNLNNIAKGAKFAEQRAVELEHLISKHLDNPLARKHLADSSRAHLLESTLKDKLHNPDTIQLAKVVEGLKNSQSKRLAFVVGGSDVTGMTALKMADKNAGIHSTLNDHVVIPFMAHRVQPKVRFTEHFANAKVKGHPDKRAFQIAIAKKLSGDLAVQNAAFRSGGNKDAQELAAYMLAVHKLTGKEVDLVGHSAGGIVSNEAYSIFKKASGGKAPGKIATISSPDSGYHTVEKGHKINIISSKDAFLKMVPTRNNHLIDDVVGHGYFRDPIGGSGYEKSKQTKAALRKHFYGGTAKKDSNKA